MYRYRKASDLAQRQQIRWVLVGGIAYGLVYVAAYLLNFNPTPAGTLSSSSPPFNSICAKRM